METAYAWAAGIIDGEGSIRITKSKPSKSARRHNPSYQIHMKVDMTHRPTIEKLAKLFDAAVTVKKSRNPLKHKEGYGVMLTDIRAVDAITKMLPYLVTKVVQAKLAVEFREKCSQPLGTQRTPNDMLKRREGFYQRMTALNKKGPGGNT